MRFYKLFLQNDKLTLNIFQINLRIGFMNKSENEFSTELDLQEMNSGFYIVSVSLDGVIYSHKLMIK